MIKEQTIRFSDDECCTLRQVGYTATYFKDRVIHKPMSKIDLEIMKRSFETAKREAQRSINLIDQAIQQLELKKDPIDDCFRSAQDKGR